MSELAKDILDVELELAQLVKEKAAISERRRMMETELSRLNARARSSNTFVSRLSPEEYRALCNRQTVLKRKIMETEQEIRPINAKMGELRPLQTALRVEADQLVQPMTPVDSDGLRIGVVRLRDKWLAFAEDQTRVNSMRVMASQIARELTELLATDVGA